MTFHNQSGSGGEPARMPKSEIISDLRHGGANSPMCPARRESLEAEFLRLLERRSRFDGRLIRLAEIIEGTSPQICGHMPLRHGGANLVLPLSGLTQAAPGVLLFRGGARG